MGCYPRETTALFQIKETIGIIVGCGWRDLRKESTTTVDVGYLGLCDFKDQ